MNRDNELIKNLNEIKLLFSKKKIRQQSYHPVLKHISTHPKITWGDLYKFLYQGSCGWQHLEQIGKRVEIKNWLRKELAEAQKPRKGETLFELLNTKTQLGRVNLRVWKDLFGNDFESLWTLMIKASSNIPDTLELFNQNWTLVKEWRAELILTERKKDKQKLEDIIACIDKKTGSLEKCKDLPLISHSLLYRKNYRPSYRIVQKEDLEEFLVDNRMEPSLIIF
ncbi:MAG: hypothetical protein ACTSQE_10165 [Candidatus Heimdallarchaeaceae archaeon]